LKTFVLSDLHISSQPGLFQRHRELSAFLRTLASRKEPRRLVLAGDTFDFLAVPGYDGLVPSRAPGHLGTILDDVSNRDVVSALAALPEAGCALLVIPGNHDLELALPTVQQALRARLRVPDDQLLFVKGGAPCRLATDYGEVAITHGNKLDVYNDIDYAALAAQAHAMPDAPFPLCPGSQIVLHLVNRFKADYSWVDRLSPISMVIVLLLYLVDDPAEVVQALDTAVGIHLNLLLSALRRAANGGTLAAVGETSPKPTTARLTQEVADALLPVDPADLTPAEQHWASRILDPQPDSHPVAPGTLAPLRTDLWPKILLRLLRNAAQQATRDLDPCAEDRYEARLSEQAPPNTAALVMGHTHCAKSRKQGASHYYNTGTWTELVRVPEVTTEQDAVQWVTRLQRNEIPSVAQLSYLEIDASNQEATSLRNWTSQSSPIAT
jgi:UDP-2,3-diacylglucosamine pyrophosphatase LpxH